MRRLPEMIVGRDAIRGARLDNRAAIVQRRRHDRRGEGVLQITLVVGGFVDQNAVILPSTAGAPRVVDRPEIDVSAVGQPDLSSAQAAVDGDAGN